MGIYAVSSAQDMACCATLASFVNFPNLQNFLGRKLSCIDFCPTTHVSTSPGVHVVNIIQLSASQQMRWIAASGVITAMSNSPLIWIFTCGQEVGHAVCIIPLPGYYERAISLYKTSDPWPAFSGFSFIHFVPKSLGTVFCNAWERLILVCSHIVSITDDLVRAARQLHAVAAHPILT